MGTVNMDIDVPEEQCIDPFSFARSYQLDALEKAIEGNTIVYLETGAGKTLIAIMLLRRYAYRIRKPSTKLAIFLVPKVVLVKQQAEAVMKLTDLKVGMYWGDMGLDYWDAARWKEEQAKHEVLVMTPMILLNGLRHCLFKLEQIELLIFDECHHATGKDSYACIMKEFYHHELHSKQFQLPKILGLTASLVNCKGSNSSSDYWKTIEKLETILHSKVYACGGEAVLSQFIPSSTTRVVEYDHKGIPYNISEQLTNKLTSLKETHESSLKKLELSEHSEESARKNLSRLHANFLACLSDLGLWMPLKAAESYCSSDTDIFLWGNLDLFGETIIKKFSNDVAELLSAHIPTAPGWCIGDDLQGDIDDGLLTSKVSCLVNCLLEYRSSENLRCLIFVERVVTSIVLNKFLTEVLQKYNGWKCEYIAGNSSKLQSQSRKLQNKIVESFREGKVNVIVATSILEEGLDVQSCNVVIRFDPCPNVCSFIQSRGRARKEKSDFLIMVKSGDKNTISRVKNYLECGERMKEESLRHASIACKPLEIDSYSHLVYRVESTGAIVNLNSCISLIYYYCSRLPSDGYFKPTPRCKIDKNLGTCILYLPMSCPLASISVQDDPSIVKKVAYFEACKKLHEMGELTDNLIPKIVMEEAVMQQTGNESYDIQQPLYFPSELIGRNPNSSDMTFYCYLLELKPGYALDIEVHNFLLATTSEFDSDILGMDINLQVDRGNLVVHIKYTGVICLRHEQVLACRKFQSSFFRILLDHNLNKVEKSITFESDNKYDVDYLLLPTVPKIDQSNKVVDWTTVASAFISCKRSLNDHTVCFLPANCGRVVQTKSEVVCSCMLQSAIVRTPHNGRLYHVSGFFDELNGSSLMLKRDGMRESYKEYFMSRHEIVLQHGHECLLKGRSIFPVPNFLQSCRQVKTKESSGRSVELPPELCDIIMSPISISTLYSFSFAPSILHRLESLLIASNLKKLHLKRNLQNIEIPTSKVLEAITTKKCQEAFHLESLEALGDSFLKYATCQYLFKTFRSQHEGLLSIKKDSIISNASLCRLGCERKLPGFIRNEFFDPQNWIVPGDQSSDVIMEEDEISSSKIYISRKRNVKSKTVADVVEALIGAYLSTAGEPGAILFLDWLGIPLDFVNTPYKRQLQLQPERLVNVEWLESLLNYSFRDHSLLVEALTHGSYMLPEIPTCYQRLEFLGDAVLDYVITWYLYKKYPGMQPGLLTDLRSASVNNDCYAQCAIRASLHKHILHASHTLQNHIIKATSQTDTSSLTSTYGWESETPYPKVLGDIIESLAGAILVDSGYDKEAVFNSISPLLEPLITPETVCYHPVRELNQLCQKKHFDRLKSVTSCQDGKASRTVEVVANGVTYKHTAVSDDKKTAKKVASKEVLKALKANIPGL
ncbi:unnamed protein product [Rhodiola kirilowii]